MIGKINLLKNFLSLGTLEIEKEFSFFKDFLQVSDFRTILILIVLGLLFGIIYYLTKTKKSFNTRVIVATILGLILGIGLQIISGFPDDPKSIVYLSEATAWFGLFGNGFMNLIRMVVIPLVIVSIIHIIINMEGGSNVGHLVRNTIIITMAMVAVSVIVGLILGNAFSLGKGIQSIGDREIRETSSLVGTLGNLIPKNPIVAMTSENIIGLVVFAMFFGVAAQKMHKRKPAVIQPFYDLINSLHGIIISIVMSIIKFMPYAIVPLLASTIAGRGLASIKEAIIFIIALYIGIIIMFIIQLIALMVFKINPIYYLRKSISILVLAFTSRSSLGVLPVTIDTLTNKLGVNEGTASFVASFGTTAGMQGCAGVFPALLVIFVANASNTPITATFIIMSIIVISLGSLGIAGIPGTATMAASVALSGTGLGAHFALISPILAIDPIIDMGRTMLNVSGAITNALMVDKTLGQLNMEKYNDMSLANIELDSEKD